MTNGDIIDKVQEFVLELLSGRLHNWMYFQTVTHTQEVVKAAIEIAEESRFSPKQLEVITNHEDSSKSIAADFLRKYDYPEEDIMQVLACIEATRFPQTPKSPEAEVLADADLYHLIKPDYPKYEQSLREELNTFFRKTCSDKKWDKINYALLKKHSYYTTYGKTFLQMFKEVNVKRLETKLIK
jgi:hypothetical protein